MNEREKAQETKQDGATGITVLAVLVDVVGEVDWHRGFQFRRMRPLTVEDAQRFIQDLGGNK